MPLTNTQQGIIGQTEAAKLLVLETDGEVEVAWPWTDDEHRDIESHLRSIFSVAMAWQIKTTWRFWTHWASEVIQIPFRLPPDRVLDDPAFWYFFGYFDRVLRTFRDPVFLVPSTDVHKHAEPRLAKGLITFTFQASLKPGARDRWSSNRVATADVGVRVLEIMRNLEKHSAPVLRLARFQAPSELLWAGRSLRKAA